jgi:hypothetical protein
MTIAVAGPRQRFPAATLAAAAVAIALAGCDKPDWLTDFENSMDAAIPRITQAMDSLAADLPKLVDPIDQTLADKIKSLDTMLREQIDGLNVALDDARGQLDVALLARAQQIANFATLFSALVAQIARHEQTQLALDVDNLLATTDAEVASLLTSLRLATRNVRQEGDARLAEAYSITQDLAVRGVGGILLLLGLVAGAIVFLVKVPTLARAIAGGSVVLCMVAGVLLLLSASLRARLVPSQTLTISHNSCSGALVKADRYLVTYGRVEPLPGAAVVEAVPVIRQLLACMATATVRSQLDLAKTRLASVRHMLKIDSPCHANADCPAGRRCQFETATCTDRCAGDQECRQGSICHDYLGKCLPLCGGGGTRCPPPAVCSQGRCVASLVSPSGDASFGRPSRFIRGGLGYAAAGKGLAATLRLLPAISVE